MSTGAPPKCHWHYARCGWGSGLVTWSDTLSILSASACSIVSRSKMALPRSCALFRAGPRFRQVLGGGHLTGNPKRDIAFKLDEKTAHSSLDLIKKETGVIYRMLGIDPTKVPQNPERFREWAVILGDTAVSAGKHYWEVTTNRSHEFRIGVADVDMPRDECIGVSSRSWVFAYAHQKWHAMLGNKTIPVRNIGHPGRVGLLLDYDGGKLSLVDADKHLLIHTVGASFRGPVVPAFALWDGELVTHSGLDVPDNL